MEKMKNYYDAIIIGSGLGGLSCGNFLAKHGMKVLALEQHLKPGGYATSYKRKGYTFDVVHIINGVKKGERMERILSYLDIYDKIEFIDFPVIAKSVGPDKEAQWPADFEKYKQELISKFPLEEEGVKKCFAEMEDIWKELKDAPDKPNLFQLITYPFRYPLTVKYKDFTYKQFADQFIKDEKLKFVLGIVSFAFLGLPITKAPALAYIAMLTVLTQSSASIKGGFQKLSDAFAEQFEKASGELSLKTRVQKILVKKNRAVGVMLEDGTKVFGKYIISNADTKNTFLTLLDRKNLKDKFIDRIKNMEYSMSGIAINLAVNMNLPEETKNCAFAESFSHYGHDSENNIADYKPGYDFTRDRLTISTKLLESDGKNEVHRVTILYLPVPYDMWADLDKEKYNRLKDEISEAIIKEIERRLIPNLSRHILLKEVSTPLTYERYTSAYKGCWYDAANTISQYASRLGPKTPIKGLYLVGSKTLTGAGVGAVIETGSVVANMILKGKAIKDMRLRFQ